MVFCCSSPNNLRWGYYIVLRQQKSPSQRLSERNCIIFCLRDGSGGKKKVGCWPFSDLMGERAWGRWHHHEACKVSLNTIVVLLASTVPAGLAWSLSDWTSREHEPPVQGAEQNLGWSLSIDFKPVLLGSTHTAPPFQGSSIPLMNGPF